jgi:hypothetical protein
MRRSECDCGGGACWPCWSWLISGVLASPLVWRVAWQLSPGLIVCALFWLASLRWGIDCFHETDLAWSRRFMLLGMVGLGLNATVTLANGGYMPVLDDTVSRSVWVAATDRHTPAVPGRPVRRLQYRGHLHPGRLAGPLRLLVRPTTPAGAQGRGDVMRTDDRTDFDDPEGGTRALGLALLWILVLVVVAVCALSLNLLTTIERAYRMGVLR